MFRRALLCCALGLSQASLSQAQNEMPEAAIEVTAEAEGATTGQVSAEAETEVEAGALPVVYAQPASPSSSSAPRAPVPAVEEVEAPDSETITAETSETNKAPRLVLATTLGGLAGVVGGFGLSWGPSFIVAGTSERSDNALIGAYLMGITTWGTPLTTAVGIFAAGRAAGGRGNFGVTLLGTTLGGILGAGLAGLAYAADHSQALTLSGVLSIPVFQWAGGVLAYHLSHRARNRPRTEPRLRALPSMSLHRGGASLGWSGSF